MRIVINLSTMLKPTLIPLLLLPFPPYSVEQASVRVSVRGSRAPGVIQLQFLVPGRLSRSFEECQALESPYGLRSFAYEQDLEGRCECSFVEGAAGLDDLPVLSEIGVRADGAAQVVGLASAHGPRRVEVMAVRVADAAAAHREGRLRDNDPGEGVGDADVVRLVKKGQEPVVLAGLLPVPVLDDGEDLDLLLDDAVVRLGHPPARDGGGRVPAGEQLVAQIGDGTGLTAGHRVHTTTDPGTVMGTALPEGGQPRGTRTEGEDVEQQLGVLVMERADRRLQALTQDGVGHVMPAQHQPQRPDRAQTPRGDTRALAQVEQIGLKVSDVAAHARPPPPRSLGTDRLYACASGARTAVCHSFSNFEPDSEFCLTS